MWADVFELILMWAVGTLLLYLLQFLHPENDDGKKEGD